MELVSTGQRHDMLTHASGRMQPDVHLEEWVFLGVARERIMSLEAVARDQRQELAGAIGERPCLDPQPHYVWRERLD